MAGQGRRRSHRQFADALSLRVHQAEGKELRKIVNALIKEAQSGNVSAVREIADRLDGKPMQQTKSEVEAVVQHVVLEDPMTDEEWEEQFGAKD